MTEQFPAPSQSTQPPRRGRFKRALIFGTLIFVAGAATLVWAINHWNGARTLIIGETAPSVAETKVAPPLAQKPPTAATPDPSLSSPSAGESVSALEERMVAIGDDATAASGNATRAEGLMLAFAARRAIERGQALGYLEPAIRQHFGATQPAAVAIILSAARQPVTLGTLSNELIRLEPQLLGSGPNEGFFARISRNFSDLIVFRNAATPSTRASDRLLRAKQYLSAGSIDLALAEVSAMPGAPGADVASWKARASQFQQTQRALEVLEATSVSVAPTPKSPPVPAPAAAPPPARPQ